MDEKRTWRAWCEGCRTYLRCLIPGGMRPHDIICPLCGARRPASLALVSVDTAGEVKADTFTCGYLIWKVIC